MRQYLFGTAGKDYVLWSKKCPLICRSTIKLNLRHPGRGCWIIYERIGDLCNLYGFWIAVENLFLVAVPDVIQHRVSCVAHECANELERCDFFAVTLETEGNVVSSSEVNKWRHEQLSEFLLLVCFSFSHSSAATPSYRISLLLLLARGCLLVPTTRNKTLKYRWAQCVRHYLMCVWYWFRHGLVASNFLGSCA